VRAALIYNPNAGRLDVRRELGAVVEYLEKSNWTVSYHETSAPREATRLTRQAVERNVDVVIAAGGDGTVNEVASGLVDTDIALGVLPVGTTNVWALQMRIPTINPVFGPGPRVAKLMGDLEERIDHALPLGYYRAILLDAARVLVEGQVRAVDVGQANDRHFLMWAGVGLDAVVSENVAPEDKKNLGMWAFVGTALDTVREYQSTHVTVTLDGEVRRVNTPLIVASNIQLYGGVLPLGLRACLNDGKLDVCIFKGEGLFTFVQHVLRIVSRQHYRDPEIEYHQSEMVVIESEQPLPVHADDEPFTRTPVTIQVVPRSLNVIVPRNVPSYLFLD
jgi:diacylglycerol kinase family enzyme